MMYFFGIADIEHAKKCYRTLATQLNPEKGGTAFEFQQMQDEYKELLLHLQQKLNTVNKILLSTPKNELISELGKLAKVLIKK